MKKLFGKLACYCAFVAGHPAGFGVSFALIIIWAATGPLFHYSDTWQLVANTATSLITFLMVFLIQHSQNRDGAAIQAKLDELIRAGHAENKFVGIDLLTEDEVNALREKATTRAKKLTSEKQNGVKHVPPRRAQSKQNGSKSRPRTAT